VRREQDEDDSVPAEQLGGRHGQERRNHTVRTVPALDELRQGLV
jgi:hypothetical protein